MNDLNKQLTIERKAEKFDEIYAAVEDIIAKDGTLDDIAEATIKITARI